MVIQNQIIADTTAVAAEAEPAKFQELTARQRDEYASLYDFDPGKGWWYSNSNYALLGAVIEQVSGKSWAAFMKAEIFDKLGMSNRLELALFAIHHGLVSA